MNKLLVIFIFSVQVLSSACAGDNPDKMRLNNGWEFVKTDLGGAWEAVKPTQKGDATPIPVWTKVTLPHCFNAYDAVDPDVKYYQGPGWYR
jgi:beta-galactosidase